MLRHPLAHLVMAFVVVGLMQGFVVKIFTVPSSSMESTLMPGDRVLVNRLAAAPQVGDVVVFTADAELWGIGSAPSSDAGTTIVDAITHAARWVAGDLLGMGPTTGHTLVKRVLGTPGDTVECCDADGDVLLNGHALGEPYITDDAPFEVGAKDCDTAPVSPRCFGPLTVPERMLLVLGDHRGASSDGVSRCRGDGHSPNSCARWVREDDVIGEAFLLVWPIGRAGPVK